MLQAAYKGLDQQVYSIDVKPEPVLYIEDIAAYNQKEGLALNQEEIDYLNGVSEQLGRKLTDGEVFGFSQVNSEHLMAYSLSMAKKCLLLSSSLFVKLQKHTRVDWCLLIKIT